MHRILRSFLRLLLLILIFGLGVTGGVYYHQEIVVVLQHVGILKQDQVAENTPLPPVDTNTESVLELPNVEGPVPLIYSETLDENTIQDYLKKGAVVLPLGTAFGDKGNVVVTAHSSGTTGFGPYRFAFAKLSELTEGQEFKISTPKAIYTYRVYGKEIVWPTEVDKLPHDDRSTVTLVTCWPIWTNFKRILVNSELVNTQYRI